MNFLKGVYVIAIAVLLIVLVIAGIDAFYPFPPYPEYPGSLGPPPPYDSPEYQDWEQAWQDIQEAYRQEAALHHRNVFLIILPLGAAFVVAGTLIRSKLGIFGASLILGGLGTMIYAVSPHDLDSRLRFAGIAIALVVLVFVGYRLFHTLSQERHSIQGN